MCGIVAGIGKSNYEIKNQLLIGLERLEYRGYDSAGISLLMSQNEVLTVKSKGKISELKKKADFELKNKDSHIGIAHTRWATHGQANDTNAHPHQFSSFCIVHNGVVDNYSDIKALIDKNKLKSETDSEVILAYLSQLKGDMLTKLAEIQTKLTGSFTSVYLDCADLNHLYAIKEKSPLIIGLAKQANYISSDVSAIANHCDEFIYLEDGDMVKLSHSKVEIFDSKLNKVERQKYPNHTNLSNLSKGQYRHFMEKEIYEQPRAIEQTIQDKLSKNGVIDDIFGAQSKDILSEIENIHLIGCGTSFNACLLARYWIEDLTNIVARAEPASEYLYRKVVFPKKSLVVALSQSGETADIIATVKKVKQISPHTHILAICNTANSELVRLSDLSFITSAGIEVSVASTKAFTTQISALMLLCLSIMKIKNKDPEKAAQIVYDLKSIPSRITEVLNQAEKIEKLAFGLMNSKSALFIARGMQYPIAIEGALKLKEISYIHAEAYAAGELKHGPLALIDNNMPVIAIIDENNLYKKIKSSLEIVVARAGKLFTFTNEQPDKQMIGMDEKNCIYIQNNLSPYLSPLIFSVCLQLLAYFVARAKGTDIDQPRNLAKSVTVE